MIRVVRCKSVDVISVWSIRVYESMNDISYMFNVNNIMMLLCLYYIKILLY